MKHSNIAAELVASCLPSELAVLAAIDWLGPLDARALAAALQLPGARVTADALVARGLLLLDWPGQSRPPWYALTDAADEGAAHLCWHDRQHRDGADAYLRHHWRPVLFSSYCEGAP